MNMVNHSLYQAKNVLLLSKQYKKLLEKPPKYNLFTVLRSQSDEVRLHSRFLTDLLNPKGQHGLNQTALKLFFRNILNLKFIDNNADFEVISEYKNIDIFMVNRTTKQAVIIENKIYASDQDQQLLRYYLAIKNEGLNPENIHIYYLTLYGDSPSHNSLKGNLGSLEDERKEVVLLSYKQDIKSWVDSLIEKSAQNPALRESLIQYVEVIKELTGMSNNQEYIEKLKDLIIETNSFDVLDGLNEAMDSLKLGAQVNFWKALFSKFQNKFELFSENSWANDEESIRQSINDYMAIRNGVDNLEISIPLIKYENCYLSVNSERYDNLYIGVQNNPEKFNHQFRSCTFTEDFAVGNENEWWPVYKYMKFDDQYWALKMLNSYQVKCLHEPDYVNKFCDHIIEEVSTLFDYVNESIDKS